MPSGQRHSLCNPQRQRGLQIAGNVRNSLADAAGYLSFFVEVSAIGRQAPGSSFARTRGLTAPGSPRETHGRLHSTDRRCEMAVVEATRASGGVSSLLTSLPLSLIGSLTVRRMASSALFVWCELFVASISLGAPPDLPDGTDAATKRIATFKVPEGMKVELFAAEPKLASPVAIGLDERNRVFVAEEYRFNLGTEENRTRPFLLEDDLQIQTLDDRLKMYEKFALKFEGGMDWFRKVADQVRFVEDTDGDGRADRSTVFAPDFNGTLDGLAAGVMATDGDVYFTCIPNLWRLRDTNNDGVADERTIIHTGFGVNAGFLGHDLHGLCWGPDGKLYFSVGDRGFHVTTKEGNVLHGPRTGAVFRCYPDGSELEVVMRGLRNPQEIAFDQFGNLFAADNNCDKGDHSRLVYVLEGADAGWNMAYQSIPVPYLTGPWHAEKMWHLWSAELGPPRAERKAAVDPASSFLAALSAPSPALTADPQRPAWVLPPVGKLGAGPSGFTYYPGTGLPPRYDNHFFLCNYTGNGGIESFSIQSRGAGFEIIDEHDFMKPISATDCEFGYDGKLYVSDFVNLIWNGGSSGGRIYTLFDTKHVNDPVVRQTTELFRNGFKQLSPEKLTELLSHPDMRVRQRAQFALAAQDLESIRFLQSTLATSNSRFARLHALWGLGQLAASRNISGEPGAVRPRVPATKEPGALRHPARHAALKQIASHLEDHDIEIRAHSIKLLGDHGQMPSLAVVRKLLQDDSPRVRQFTALAIAGSKISGLVDDLIESLRTNNDADPWLRHALVMALSHRADAGELRRYETDPSPAVRMGVLLAYRQALIIYTSPWTDPRTNLPKENSEKSIVYRNHLEANARVGRFLSDERWEIVTEAARVINDFHPDYLNRLRLAEMAGSLAPTAVGPAPEALVHRVINANFILGDHEHLTRVVDLITSPHLSLAMRREALAAVMDWDQPQLRDRVTGFWTYSLEPTGRQQSAIARVLPDRVPDLLANTATELQPDVLKLIAKYKLPTDDAIFAAWVTDATKSVLARSAALRLLATRRAKQLDESLTIALKSDLAPLRAEARDVLALVRPAEAIPLLGETLSNEAASIPERQRAVTMLATLKTGAADVILKKWTDELLADQVPEPLQLDVLEAATVRDLPELKAAIDQFIARLSSGDIVTRHKVSLHGGDAERGREVFVGHRVGQCIRCHKVGDGIAGGNAGPNLHEVAKRHDRVSLLQSLVDPNAKIAKGFETVTLVTSDGKTFGGLIRKEDANEIVLEQPDGKLVTLKPSDVEERSAPKSAMPEMNRALSARELRDLVEFLSTIKGDDGPLSEVERELIDYTNKEREKLKLPPLKADPVLMRLAREQNAHMARLNQLGHELEGETFSNRMKATGYIAMAAGENCAEGAASPKEAVADWMTSEFHKSNILSDKYTHIGVAQGKSKEGKTYSTQVFAKPFEDNVP